MKPGISNWSVEPLGTLALEMKGGASISPEDFTDFGVPVLHKGSIQVGGQLSFSRDGKIHTSDEYARSNSGALVDDTFVVATLRNLVRTGETLGFVAPIPKGHQFLLAQGAYGLKLDAKRIDARYLSHLSNTWPFHREVLRRMVGTTQVHIRNGDFLAVPVPLPPLPEQRRIAAILDKADELRAKRRAALAKLDSLTQSIFLDMFGDPATNPKGWPEVAFLGEVAEIVSGVTKGRQLNGKATRSVPYLAVINVQDQELNLSTVKTIEATEEEIERYRLQRGDLLLTEGGDPDKLGRGTLWNNELPESIHQNHVFRVRLTSDVLEPVFLKWLIGSPRGKRYFLRSAKQTTGIATINMTQLRGFPLLLPPIELQRDFAVRLAALEQIETTQRDSLSMLDATFACLQHRAFVGELSYE